TTATAAPAASTGLILALDPGKFKTVACACPGNPDPARIESLVTDRDRLHRPSCSGGTGFLAGHREFFSRFRARRGFWSSSPLSPPRGRGDQARPDRQHLFAHPLMAPLPVSSRYLGERRSWSWTWGPWTWGRTRRRWKCWPSTPAPTRPRSPPSSPGRTRP